MSLPKLPEQLCHADGNYTADQMKAYGAAEYARAVDDCINTIWQGFIEGPEAMEVLMDKLKRQTP